MSVTTNLLIALLAGAISIPLWKRTWRARSVATTSIQVYLARHSTIDPKIVDEYADAARHLRECWNLEVPLSVRQEAWDRAHEALAQIKAAAYEARYKQPRDDN